jgi:hypothetical protein
MPRNQVPEAIQRPGSADVLGRGADPTFEMNQKTYRERILSHIYTGILRELVHRLEKITDELILAGVIVRCLVVPRRLQLMQLVWRDDPIAEFIGVAIGCWGLLGERSLEINGG